MDGSESMEEIRRLAAIATTRASEALGALSYEENAVKALAVYYLKSPERLLTRLRLPRRLVTVTQSVDGYEKGKISLVIARESAPSLASLLVGRHGSPNRRLGGFELDALKEAGNIISGSYLAFLGHPLGLTGVPSVPTLLEGTLDEIALSLVPQSSSLCVEAHLAAPSRGIELVVLMAAGCEQSDRFAVDPKSNGLRGARPAARP